jgi:hypothetical protein
MMYLLAALISVPSHTCVHNTPQAAARTIISSMREGNWPCLRSMTLNPDLNSKEQGLDPAVVEALSFRSLHNRSYFDIIKRNVFFDISGSGNTRSVFFILGAESRDYRKDKALFKKTRFRKGYFVCNISLKEGEWKLTDDFCFAETD